MKKVVFALAVGGLLWSCGGGVGGDGDTTTTGGGNTQYGVKIQSFSITPNDVGLGDSFKVEGKVDFTSANSVVVLNIKVTDSNGQVSESMGDFYCGTQLYNCINTFTVNCAVESRNGREWIRCRDPLGSERYFAKVNGTFNVTLKACVWAVTKQYCDYSVTQVTIR